MHLDPRTLLFSLVLINALTVLSLLVAATGNKQDGMGKWAAAMLLETLTWVLISVRGYVPDAVSIIVANGLKAGAHAFVLAAICEFQGRRAPRWQYGLPIGLTVVAMAVFIDDMPGRFIWGSLIYGFQMVLVARVLLADRETRQGRAWRLLFGGVVMIMLVLGLRAATALSGPVELAVPQGGEPHPVQLISFVVVMATALLGSIGFVLMVKERSDREILKLAMTDSLTQVFNRHALMAHAERELARRSGAPLAFLMIDVDHFKHINDTHGHPTGDEVLRGVAKLLASRLRRQDILGRYGGEEFCVVAPATDEEGARTLAESLREIVAVTPHPTEHGELSATVSIGVAHCPHGALRELRDLLAEADLALYQAKQTGRNCVVDLSGLVSAAA